MDPSREISQSSPTKPSAPLYKATFISKPGPATEAEHAILPSNPIYPQTSEEKAVHELLTPYITALANRIAAVSSVGDLEPGDSVLMTLALELHNLGTDEIGNMKNETSLMTPGLTDETNIGSYAQTELLQRQSMHKELELSEKLLELRWNGDDAGKEKLQGWMKLRRERLAEYEREDPRDKAVRILGASKTVPFWEDAWGLI